jgi:hypothetical protein
VHGELGHRHCSRSGVEEDESVWPLLGFVEEDDSVWSLGIAVVDDMREGVNTGDVSPDALELDDESETETIGGHIGVEVGDVSLTGGNDMLVDEEDGFAGVTTAM